MKRIIFVVAALALAAGACGDDDEAGPDTVIRGDGGISNPIDGGLDGSTSKPDASTDAGTGTVKGAPGCFAGKAATSTELLNACAEGYQEFDNSKRLPNYTGKLPPLN